MKWLLLLICLNIACLLRAQDPDSLSVLLDDGTRVTLDAPSLDSKNPSTLPATREYASENIEMRRFAQKKWHEIVDSSNYSDTRTRKNRQGERSGSGGETDDDFGARRGDQSDDESYDYDREEGTSINLNWLGPLGQLIFYGAIAAIIITILLQIARNTSFRTNTKRPSVSTIVGEEIHDISELDTENLIQAAHNAKDYKLAIRLYFLDLLKRLNENGTIVWTKDKTNRDYLSELFSKQYYFHEVRSLTLAYERVWYGEHIPTEERYHALRNEFQEINQKFKVS